MGLDHCHVLPPDPANGRPNAIGYALSCTADGAGYMTMYARPNCTGDVLNVRHDDTCECADPMTPETASARRGGDCAVPANGEC